ncbi:lytic transglycosylase domain-containing protein [Rhodomicrobium sp. Az07]|uniref:lytic transglycosylase domain-containing protein n=1 Tax=Rhodomicrobium sp. Az07 TaxID=2839034 RepID=UPI001BE84C3E|nr:lytic transglycosylase domain-containing protein [Rhodomicrobium sp. Az07]MBT3069438.1 lytic transglycosylase domain-containing protein [Rhodomicrobium sp. Az07]
MSTLDPKPNALADRFRFLKAIIIGSALGFFAVSFVPYLLPPQDEPAVSASTASKPQSAGEAKPSKFAGTRPAPIHAVDRGLSHMPTPAAVQQSPSARSDSAPAMEPRKGETPRVSAVELKFPKPFPEEDMTASLDPLLSYRLGDSDTAAIKDAISAAAKGNNSAARDAIKKISDPSARKFAEWRRVRAASDFDDTMAFRSANPLFPEPPIDATIEKSLFLANAPAAAVLKFYTNRKPASGAGAANLGGALMETGERERGATLVRYAWSRYALEPAVQDRFEQRFGSLLTDNDRRARAAMLDARARAKDDPGSKVAASEAKGIKGAARVRAKRSGGKAIKKRGGRKGKSTGRAKGKRQSDAAPALAARPAFAGLASGFAATSHLHLAAMKSEDTKPETKTEADADATASDAKTNDKAAAKDDKPAKPTLQSKAQEDALDLRNELARGPLSLLARLKSLRKAKEHDRLWSILRSVDPEKVDFADPDKWWDFRRTEVRRALNDDRVGTAYAIASKHGQLGGENLSEAQFLSGWIALRFLKDTKLAEKHFEAAYAVKGFSRDEARAAFWLGRTRLELDKRKEAERLFKDAASRAHTYYGSLARQALERQPACEFRAPLKPSQEAIAAFVKEDAFKALVIAKQLDMTSVLVLSSLDLARQLSDPEQIVLLLELLERIAPPHLAIRAAKIALLRGYPVDAYAFPTLLPKFDPLGGSHKLEVSLLNALTRQESEFNAGSVSRVGARGLMQLMPQTAKLVASRNRMKYDLRRLISDPSYNVTLGSAFLAKLYDGYDGSYVLSLAAYNAGPGRVRQWIKTFGDPRARNADPVDWVERIPFTETRNYVQRILESVQLYRCRLERGKAHFQLVEDLHRGRPGRIPHIADLGSGSSSDDDDEPATTEDEQ